MTDRAEFYEHLADVIGEERMANETDEQTMAHWLRQAADNLEVEGDWAESIDTLFGTGEP